MGSGKSTVLKLLAAEGYKTVPEPAREILADQRSIGGTGVPEKDPKLFTQLLLSRAIQQFKQAQNLDDIVFFDRGIPDNIAYAQLFDFDYQPVLQATKLYRYDATVFFFPAWEKIYSIDDERKMTFAEAKLFGDNLKNIYTKNNYYLIKVPLTKSEDRLQFIISHIS